MKSLPSSLMNKKPFASILVVLSIVGYGALVFAVGPFAPGTELDPACSPYINNDPNQGVDTDCTVTTSSGGSRWSLVGGIGPDIYFDGGNVGVGADDPQFNFQVGDQTSDSILFVADSNSSIFDATKGFVGAIQTTASFTAFTGLAEEVSFLGPGVGFLGSGFFGDGTTRGLSGMTNIESNNYGITGRSVARWATLFENTMDDGSEISLSVEVGSQNTSPFSSNLYADFSDNTFSSSRILQNVEQLSNGGDTSITFYTISDRSGSELKNEFSFNTQGFGFGNTSSFSGLVNNGETNKFYFDYENQAIRLGSVDDDAWDFGSGNVGNRSIAIGFMSPSFGGLSTATASGENAIAIGTMASASNDLAMALGFNASASGQWSTAIGFNADASGTVALALFEGDAIGERSFAFNGGVANSNSSMAWDNSVSNGISSRAFGYNTTTHSAYETSIGIFNTPYIAIDENNFELEDRLFIIGNGSANNNLSDAFTVLKNGLTGIGFDNFEATGNTELLQVNGDIRASGGLVQTSDRRLKKNITPVSYGLETVLALQPVSYSLIKNNSDQIGFIAQDIQEVIPELVSDGSYLALNYQGFIPVLTKAIQELDLKLENIQSASTVVVSGGFSLDGLRDWLGDKLNGINKLFVRELCLTDGVEEECITMDELRQLKQSSQISFDSNNSGSSNNSLNDNSENDQEIIDDTVATEDSSSGSEEVTISQEAPSEESSEEVVSDSPEEVITEPEPTESSEPADSSSSDSSGDMTDGSNEITQ